MINEFKKLAGIKEDTESLNRLKSDAVNYMELPVKASGFVCGNCRSFEGEACLNPKVKAPVSKTNGCCNLFFPADKKTVAPAEWTASTVAVGESVRTRELREASEIYETDLPEKVQKAIAPLKSKLALKVRGAWDGIHGYIVEFEVSGQTQDHWRLAASDFNLIGKTKGLRWVQMDAKTLTLGL